LRRSGALIYSAALGFFFFASMSAPVFAATVRLAPSDTTIEVGDTVLVRIALTSEDQAVNAVSGVLHFPNDSLELTSLSKSASIIGLWVQEPSFSNLQGTVRFEGVILNPGYTGSGGTILTAKFRALKKGLSALTLTDTQALANDGSGTDILTASSGTSITITTVSVVPAPKATPTPSVPSTVEQAPLETTTTAPPSAEAPVESSPSRTMEEIVGAWVASIGIGFLGTSLVILMILMLCMGYLRYHALKSEMRKELRAIDATMHKALLLLRDEVEEFVQALDEEKVRRKLTLLESKFVKQMKQNLADTEKVMKKTLHEAEDMLG
jgi:hypothetical protein